MTKNKDYCQVRIITKKLALKIHSELISQTGKYEGLRDEKFLEWIYAHEKE